MNKATTIFPNYIEPLLAMNKILCIRTLHICNGLIVDGAVICFGNSHHMEISLYGTG